MGGSPIRAIAVLSLRLLPPLQERNIVKNWQNVYNLTCMESLSHIALSLKLIIKNIGPQNVMVSDQSMVHNFFYVSCSRTI